MVFAQRLAAPRHHLFGGGEHPVNGLDGHRFCAGIVPAERGEVLGGKPRIENHTARVHHRTGIECGADAAFAVVTHEQTAELESSA